MYKKLRLTPKQYRFCQEYIIDLNATQAAIRSGFSKKTAQEQSSRLLSNAMVAEKIQELMNMRSKRTQISADVILEELLRLARVDIAGAYDKDGKLLPVHMMAEDVRRAIASIDVFEEFEGVGRDREYVGDTKKLKFYDKTKALELLGKHLKLFTDVTEHKGKLTLEELVVEAQKKSNDHHDNIANDSTK